MTTATIKTIQATFVSQGSPTKNYSKNGTMALRNTANTDCEIHAKFTVPGPRGALFNSGKFRIYASKAIPSRTYKLRLITATWDFAKLKWSNKPASSALNEVTVTAAVSAKGFIEFDVTTLLNQVSAGTPWFGFRIYMNDAESTSRYFYTSKGSTLLAPVLTVDYSTAPGQPQTLNPGGGRAVSIAKPTLTADYIDYAGSTDLGALQVQIHSSNNFTTPDWDSGEVVTSVPQLDLSGTSFGGITAGQTKWWRIKFRDSENLWSVWSEPQSFTRVAKGVAAIISPGESPNDYVREASPPILHSFTGQVQRSIQLLLTNDGKTAVLADTGKITTADTGNNLPDTSGLIAGTYYRVLLRVWDMIERASTPGDTAYVEVERRFRYLPTNSVPPFLDLTATQIGTTPWVKLQGTTSPTPDFLDVFRDGKLITLDKEPEDLLVGGSTYAFIDRMASPRTPHVWEIRARANGANGSDNSTVTAEIKPRTAYLSTLDGAIAIPFLNYSSGLTKDDGSTVVEIANSDEPITIYQGTNGWKGGFDGTMSAAAPGPLGNETARDHLARFLELGEVQNQGRACILTWADQSIPCVVSKIDYKPTVYNEEIVYIGSFYVTEKKGLLQ